MGGNTGLREFLTLGLACGFRGNCLCFALRVFVQSQVGSLSAHIHKMVGDPQSKSRV